MNVLVTGSSGLIGSALVTSLRREGHRVTRLVRSKIVTGADVLYWDPMAGPWDADRLEGSEAVVHLAGESISNRWTPAKKVRIQQSRIDATRLLCESLGRLKQRPAVLVSASAIGYFGDRGEEHLTEESTPGSGFLSEVCREWEAAADLASQWGLRVVRLRIGIVLSAAGGALAKMLPPFRMGLGGRLGSGRQYMSWIALDDLVGVIIHALMTPELKGPVNAVSPAAVMNWEFTKVLGKVLGRPTLFPVPEFAVRLAFGEMGEQLLLASTRVEPVRLKTSGYRFQFPEIESALRHVLGKPSKP